MMQDGSKVRIKNHEFIDKIEIKDCVGWEDEDESCLPYIRELASGIGEIEDSYFDEYDGVWGKFGEELIIVVPKDEMAEVLI